jgi:hypothetical protein
MPEECRRMLRFVMFKVVELVPSEPQIQICNLNFTKEYCETYKVFFSVRGVTDVEARGEFACSYFLKEKKIL